MEGMINKELCLPDSREINLSAKTKRPQAVTEAISFEKGPDESIEKII